MVAIKTCKGKKTFVILSLSKLFYCILALSHESDKDKLLKEVTAMLAFQHPNVMTLVGMCFDGEIPLILMPYMSEGSVLGYVKQNKSELLLDRESNNEKV